MGVNYGQKRGRMEILGGLKDATAYSIGARNIKYSHIDEDVLYDEFNKRVRAFNKRFTER